MQHINNDMDELFNKAGRDYPLKTDGSDWNTVFSKLQQPEPSTTPLPPKSNNRKYLWLLLLLPLAYLTYRPVKEDVLNNSAPKNNTAASGAVSGNTSAKSGKTDLRDPVTMSSHRNDLSNDNVKPPITGDYKNKNNQPGSPPGLTNTKQENKQNIIKIHDEEAIEPHQQGSAGSEMNIIKTPTRLLHENERIPGLFPIWNRPGYEKPLINIIPVIKTDSAIVHSEVKKSKQKPHRNIYLGVIAGPDLSTIKYQEINNAGYSIGILAGYTFKSRLSVELGALWSKKKYYTDGKYFDKSGINIPWSTQVAYLDGGCEMFEFPLSVKYDFSSGSNSFYATAGVTSYFMKKEDYTYLGYAGGSSYEGHRSYNNSGNHFFANAQFSIGYNYALSSKLTMRVEPYIKVPLKNIGLGNLPITSTGIYFGIMRNIK